MRTRLQLLATACVVMLALVTSVHAQMFPSGPVKIILGTGAGSSPDIIARLIADRLTKRWGQQVIVLNQPGAGGAIAIRAAANAAPDGRTLYLSLASNFVALPDLQSQLPFDVGRDFVPVGFVGEQPMVIAANAALRLNTLSELIARAKQRPGELNIAGGNPGSIPHLTAEWLRSAAGVDLTIVHYPGTPQALTDVLSGRVPLIVDAITGISGLVSDGRLKPVAIASERRLPALKDWPTATETLPGFIASGWLALMAPPKTPINLAEKIARDLQEILAQPENELRLEELGTYVRPMGPGELTRFIQAQQQTWKPIIAKASLAAGN